MPAAGSARSPRSAQLAVMGDDGGPRRERGAFAFAISRVASKPSITGIWQSIRTRIERRALHLLQGVWPFSASVTSMPRSRAWRWPAMRLTRLSCQPANHFPPSDADGATAIGVAGLGDWWIGDRFQHQRHAEDGPSSGHASTESSPPIASSAVCDDQSQPGARRNRR